MSRRTVRVASVFATLALAALLYAPLAEAARRSNPAQQLFVTTPFGVIPKSQFYGWMMTPQQYQTQRAAEQKYLDSINKKNSASKSKTTKPTTKKT